jgi:hypothetical protein
VSVSVGAIKSPPRYINYLSTGSRQHMDDIQKMIAVANRKP